jgi:signal transduction histidine kinase
LLSLDSDSRLTSRQHDWAQQIQHAGWHLLEMIDETSDLAAIETGSVRLTIASIDVVPIVAACRAMVLGAAAQRGISLDERLASDLPAVRVDAGRVKQVLTNLLSNAVKYNRQNGSVTVTARCTDDAMVEIAVTDTGLGMTPEQLQALFQPYNRLGRELTDIKGTGIGLVISRHLTELMGGSLRVESRRGEGSTFTITLPTNEAADA